MISLVGRALVMGALGFAAAGAFTGLAAGARRNLALWAWTRRMAAGFAFSMIAANLLMVYALLSHDFSVAYVAEVGSLATPPYYTVISLWASLNGSILFWGGILGVYVGAWTWIHRKDDRDHVPYSIGVLLAVAVFFSLLVASIANPFAPVANPLTDGPGPNPLLQNHWLMAFHPPMLYLGYVGMAVPFSMTCAALLAGRLEHGFLVPLRRWMLVPWTFLTIGIAMGGWWSYEVLGWGGYWAWDPVENASFMPWLTATAFLHSVMVLQRTGHLRTWTLVLGMSTFLLTLLGTFMTRSGVFNSVHSFTQSDIGPVFLAFIAVCFVASVLLLAVRDNAVITSADDATAKPLGSSPTSREFAILLQNLAFSVFTFTVLLGVLYPLITEQLWDKRVSVGEPYFDRMALPLGMALVFLMGVGPALPWGRMAPDAALRKLAPPAVGALVAAAIAAAFGVLAPWPLGAIALCGFAFVANVAEYVEPVRARVQGRGEPVPTAMARVFARGRRRFGGHVAHFGFLMAVVAIAMSSGYKVERDLVLKPGETGTLNDWSFTYQGARRVQEPHRSSLVASFDLARDGKHVTVIEPKLNNYTRMREPVGTPAVYTTLAGDVYVSLLQVTEDGGTVSIRAMTMPLVAWLWISAGVMSLGSLLVLWPQRAGAVAPAAAPVAIGEAAK